MFLIGLLVLLSSCSEHRHYAPVTQAWHESYQPGIHKVRQGETLYAIAWRYDVDYRDLARHNRLRSPYALKIGQKLRYRWTKKSSRWSKVPTKVSKLSEQRKCLRRKCWYWPTKGKIIQRFSLKKRQKGIDLATRVGAPVTATAAGRVAYAGDGIPGYGNLLIIKHDSLYLSAYAHNKRLLVKEGQSVRAGQVIAKAGYLKRRLPGLHFEIRKAGRPIDPLRYLAQRR